MIVTKYAPDSTFAEQRASLDQTLKLVWAEDPRFGAMRPQTWQQSVEMFEKYKLVDAKLNVSDVVDNSILSPDKQAQL